MDEVYKCEGKRFEYHLIISLWNSKKLQSVEPVKLLAFIRKSYLREMFLDDNGIFDQSFAVLANSLVLAIQGKWLPFEKVEHCAVKISDKFHCDIAMVMTDDDGCAKGSFIEGNPKKVYEINE